MLSARRKLTPTGQRRSRPLPESRTYFAGSVTPAIEDKETSDKVDAYDLPALRTLTQDAAALARQAGTWSFEYLSQRPPDCTVPEALAEPFPWTSFDQGLPKAEATSLSE